MQSFSHQCRLAAPMLLTFATTNQNTMLMLTTNTTPRVKNLVSKYLKHVSSTATSLAGADSAAELQLLSFLYAEVAGAEADPKVVELTADYNRWFDHSVFSDEELSFLKANFGEVAELLSSSYNGWQIRFSNDRAASADIVELLKATLYPADGDRIYLPYAGLADLAVAYPGCRCTGFETNENLWALAMIRLYANGLDADIACGKPGAMEEGTAFDAIVCLHAPLAYKGRAAEAMEYYAHLAPGGCLWMLTTAAELCSTGDDWAALRGQLLASEAVEAVVQLPAGVGLGHSKRLYVLCLSKEKRGFVKMVDLSFAGREKGFGLQDRRLDVDSVAHVLEHIGEPEYEDSRIYLPVPATDVDSRVLLPQHYLAEQPDQSVPLADIAEAPGRNLAEAIRQDKLPEGAKVVKPSDLATSFAHAELKPDRLARPDGGNGYYFRVGGPAVFYVAGGSELSYAYTGDADVDVYASADVNVLRPKEGSDCRYIVALLTLPWVQCLLSAYAGADPAGIVKPWMLGLVRVQKETAEERRERVERMALESMTASERLRKEEYERHIKAIRLRKHAITQVHSACTAVFNALNGYRKAHGGHLSDSDTISRLTGMTVGEAFGYLDDSMRRVATMVANMADHERWKPADAKWIEPQGFLDRYIEANRAGWVSFVPAKEWGAVNTNLADKDLPDPFNGGYILRKGDPLTQLSFAPDALAQVLDNIVQNAVSHGFTDPDRHDYEVRFAWRNEGTSAVIEVANNGAPLPEGMDAQLVLEYGYSATLNHDGHSGLGGYEVAETMRTFGGSVEVLSTPGEKYTVTYRLRFKSNAIFSFPD